MQIKLNKVKYKDIKNINFEIEDSKITGIVSNDMYRLNDINYCISNNVFDEGSIEYNGDRRDICLISLNLVDNFYFDEIKLEEKDDELLRLLDIEKDLLNRDYNTLSTCEKIKVILFSNLIKDPNTILIDNVLDELDLKQRNKIIKLLINLKKIKNKTIVVSSINIDLIYEFIDSIVIIYNNKCLFSHDKYTFYDKYMNDVFISKPFIRKIENIFYKSKNIDLGKNDSINELIKSIYREIR